MSTIKFLLEEIEEKNLKTLKTQLVHQQRLLYENTKWIRETILRHLLNTIITKEESEWIRTHNKKYENLINKKKAINEISENLNSVITNLSSRILNNNESKILTKSLKHGIAISFKQNDILASSEALSDKLESKDILKENISSIQRAKNSIPAMSFSLLSLDVQQIIKDKNKITMINNFLKDVLILKPGKRNFSKALFFLKNPNSE